MSGSAVDSILVLLCSLFTMAALAVSMLRNGDIFSPLKIYILFNVFFYLDVYIGAYATEVILIYLLQCFMLFVISFIEPKRVVASFEKLGNVNKGKVVSIIWIVSFFSIFNQLLIILEMGGIFNYINNISLRVEYFRGKGYVLILNNWISIMSVVYLSFLLNVGCAKKSDWILYFIHFVVFVCIALLSGSRSFLLMTVLVQIFIYHYCKKNISVMRSVGFITLFLFIAAFLGGVRNSVDVSDDGFKFKTGDAGYYNLAHFKYGLTPLEIVFDVKGKELLYGETYISLITNFIPRSIFPGKLDTGGVAFTKIYTGNQWGGLSNLATGSVTEAIINFGYFWGVLIGLALLFVFYILGFYLYSRLKFLGNSNHAYMVVIIYIYFLLAFARYSYSEFSYTFYHMILNVLVPLLIVWGGARVTFFRAFKRMQ